MENKKWVLRKPFVAEHQVLMDCDNHMRTMDPNINSNSNRIVVGPEDSEPLSVSEVKELLRDRDAVGSAFTLGRFTLAHVMAYASMRAKNELKNDKDPLKAVGGLPAMSVFALGFPGRDLALKSLWLLALETAHRRKMDSIFTFQHRGAIQRLEGEEIWWPHVAKGLTEWSRNPSRTGIAMKVIRKGHFESAITALKMEGASIPGQWVGETPMMFRP